MILACLWQWIIQKACCQQVSGTTFQVILAYSFTFKGRERHRAAVWVCMVRLVESRLPSQSYCLPWNSVEDFHISVSMQTVDLLGSGSVHYIYRSPWYLPERTTKDWHRKEIFFPAKMWMHDGLSCLFKFCFLIFRKSSTIWMCLLQGLKTKWCICFTRRMGR